MDGTFVNKGIDSVLESRLIIDTQTYGQIPMLRASGQDHVREEPSHL